MKRYASIIAIVLCALITNVKAVNKFDNPGTTTCACCKNCTDETCKSLCAQWSAMTPEQQKGEEGKKVKAQCLQICKEKKCCSADGKATCEGMQGKGCCSKK